MIGAALAAFAVIFPAELPDKTAVATLVLAHRFRAAPVVAGVWAAFAVHVSLAVAVGQALSLLPHAVVAGVSAAIFVVAGVLLLRSREEQQAPADEEREDASWLRIALTAFGVVFVAEWGDFTQIGTANLAARSGEPVGTAIGALLALWSVTLLAAMVGPRMLRVIPVVWVKRVAGAVCLIIAALTLLELL